MSWVVAALVLLMPTAFASPALAERELAVTVDDLPSHGALPPGTTRQAIADQMIQALKRHTGPGVYGFVNGRQLRQEPELGAILRAWRQAGFVLANHTYSHLDLMRVSADDYVFDIERNEEIVARFSPPDTPRYFRYPYLQEGNTEDKRKTVRTWLTARAYTIAPVTVSLEDETWNDLYARCVASGEPAVTRLKVLFIETAIRRLAAFDELSRRLYNRSIKHVLLLHMGAFDALVLDDLLTAFRAAGTRYISLPEAIEDPAYQTAPKPFFDGDATFLVQIARTRRVPIPTALTGPPEEAARLCR